MVEAPAFEGAVGAQPAGVARAYRHGAEASPRGAGPRISPRSPALERVVGAQPAGAAVADRQGGEGLTESAHSAEGENTGAVACSLVVVPAQGPAGESSTQAWLPPAWTELNSPEAGSPGRSREARARPRNACICAAAMGGSAPQHSTAPSVRKPQEKPVPAATWANCPPGASAWPRSLAPQHATVPSTRTAQLCSSPVATALNAPAGATSRVAKRRPQHSMSPSTRTAHEWSQPVDSDRNLPSGGSVSPQWLAPQQSIAPSVRTPHEWRPPLSIVLNRPSWVSPAVKLRPQHSTVLSARRPHDWSPPARDRHERPVGGVGLAPVVVAPASDPAAAPQHAGVPGAGRNREEVPAGRGDCLGLGDAPATDVAVDTHRA